MNVIMIQVIDDVTIPANCQVRPVFCAYFLTFLYFLTWCQVRDLVGFCEHAL